MRKPYFSIIIPTLNEEYYLPKLLDAISKQTDQEFEVFVIDGLSADRTHEIAEFYRRKIPLTYIKFHANNVASQRNIGAFRAKGKYLIFLDADVSFNDDFMLSLQAKLERRRIDFASTRILFDSQLLFDRVVEFFGNGVIWVLNRFGIPIMTGQALIFARSAFVKIGGFNASVVHGEDGELVRRATKNHLRGEIFTDLKIKVSTRRFDKEGRLIVLAKYLYANIYQISKGPIKKPLFSYIMGGKQ